QVRLNVSFLLPVCMHRYVGAALNFIHQLMDEQVIGQLSGQPKTNDVKFKEDVDRNKPTYCVTDVPSWYLCIFLAIQHYLTAFGGIISIPLILSEGLCLQHDSLTQSLLINTIFFVSGICTLLQVTLGVRLPILQGGTFALVTPAMAILDKVLVGFSGLIGFLMRFIGPMTIAPTVSLIGLSLYDSAGDKAGCHWGISAMTAVLIILFSQYLRLIQVPLPAYNKSKKLHTSNFFMFQTMPILLGLAVSWLVCYLLTIYDVLPKDSAEYGHLARTDVKGNVVSEASWFRVPYPGQWGVPTVNLAAVFGMLAGILCSMAESVGDYHACARLSGAPPPPNHAINRGIGVEGVGSLLAGAFGTGNGTTSFSENVAALGITKVGSRTVILLSGIFMILMGVLGKIGAVFATIPTPVIGGMFIIMFGVITAAGISNLQYVDMNSSRNIFVFGFSLFSALVIPNWITKNPGYLQTGITELDQVLRILFTTHMFIGGFFGFFLDNTIPGTKGERGLLAWNQVHLEDSTCSMVSEEVYDFPCGIAASVQSRSWIRYVPFCPRKNGDPQKKQETAEAPQSTCV
uniref:Solute carrier family 23 member 2 n=1 Tax=Oryzias sinensis TaxID=183150 RepID=A0A8C7XJI2_9TELE